MLLKSKHWNRFTAFKSGDVVQVCSKEWIKKTLDISNCHDNLLFMRQMWQYCGNSYAISKVVNNIFDEKRCKIYKTILPFFILEGLICDGKVDDFNHTCDHSCYLLWHKDWLQKIKS